MQTTIVRGDGTFRQDGGKRRLENQTGILVSLTDRSNNPPKEPQMIRPLCFALALVVAASTAPVQAAKHTSDSIKTVKERLEKKKAVIIDVREKREWDNGHLEQAKLVPLSKLKDATELKELMKKLPKDKKTIIYCH
jgi:hypothetical protein